MATRSATITEIKTWRDHVHSIQWTGLLNGDDGAPVIMPGSAVRSIQFAGTFGTGGTILLEGSNDGTNYVTLTDPQGNAITKTSAGIEQIEEITVYVRPRVSAGDGTTTLVATLFLGRNNA
jgi:hypothetical protein